MKEIRAGGPKLKSHLIGQTLVEGPKALFPPKTMDGYGWLEPDLALHWRTDGWRTLRSVLVYTDASMNRNRGFLEPVIRVATWHRSRDLAREGTWPHVELIFGRPKDWPVVRRISKALHEEVGKLPFVPYGLSKCRGAATVRTAAPSASFMMKTGNGVQWLEFGSPALRDDPLTTAVRKSMDDLAEMSAPFDPTGWTERYGSQVGIMTLTEWTIGACLLGDWSPPIRMQPRRAVRGERRGSKNLETRRKNAPISREF